MVFGAGTSIVTAACRAIPPRRFKGEWEDQITKFIDLPLRLACYETPA